MAVQHYKELTVWQKAMDLIEGIYQLSASFPSDERFGLTNQMRRAAVSVACNVAEGQGRGASRDFLHYLRMANGSRQEVETQLIISERLGFASKQQIESLLTLAAEVGRLIAGLARSVEAILATGN